MVTLGSFASAVAPAVAGRAGQASSGVWIEVFWQEGRETQRQGR